MVLFEVPSSRASTNIDQFRITLWLSFFFSLARCSVFVSVSVDFVFLRFRSSFFYVCTDVAFSLTHKPLSFIYTNDMFVDFILSSSRCLSIGMVYFMRVDRVQGKNVTAVSRKCLASNNITIFFPSKVSGKSRPDTVWRPTKRRTR